MGGRGARLLLCGCAPLLLLLLLTAPAASAGVQASPLQLLDNESSASVSGLNTTTLLLDVPTVVQVLGESLQGSTLRVLDSVAVSAGLTCADPFPAAENSTLQLGPVSSVAGGLVVVILGTQPQDNNTMCIQFAQDNSTWVTVPGPPLTVTGVTAAVSSTNLPVEGSTLVVEGFGLSTVVPGSVFAIQGAQASCSSATPSSALQVTSVVVANPDTTMTVSLMANYSATGAFSLCATMSSGVGVVQQQWPFTVSVQLFSAVTPNTLMLPAQGTSTLTLTGSGFNSMDVVYLLEESVMCQPVPSSNSTAGAFFTEPVVTVNSTVRFAHVQAVLAGSYQLCTVFSGPQAVPFSQALSVFGSLGQFSPAGVSALLADQYLHISGVGLSTSNLRVALVPSNIAHCSGVSESATATSVNSAASQANFNMTGPSAGLYLVCAQLLPNTSFAPVAGPSSMMLTSAGATGFAPGSIPANTSSLVSVQGFGFSGVGLQQPMWMFVEVGQSCSTANRVSSLNAVVAVQSPTALNLTVVGTEAGSFSGCISFDGGATYTPNTPGQVFFVQGTGSIFPSVLAPQQTTVVTVQGTGFENGDYVKVVEAGVSCGSGTQTTSVTVGTVNTVNATLITVSLTTTTPQQVMLCFRHANSASYSTAGALVIQGPVSFDPVSIPPIEMSTITITGFGLSVDNTVKVVTGTGCGSSSTTVLEASLASPSSSSILATVNVTDPGSYSLCMLVFGDYLQVPGTLDVQGVTALTPMFHIQSTSQSTFTLTVQGFGFSQSNLIWAVPHEHACTPPPVNCSVGLCLSSPTSSTTPTSLQSIARPLTIGLYTVCISFSGQAANAQPVPGDAFSVTGVTALSPVVLPPEENGVTMSVQGLGLLSSNGGSARFLAPTDSCSSGSTSQLVVSNFAGNSTDMTFKVATTSAARYLVCVLVSSSPSNSYSSAGVITVQGPTGLAPSTVSSGVQQVVTVSGYGLTPAAVVTIVKTGDPCSDQSSSGASVGSVTSPVNGTQLLVPVTLAPGVYTMCIQLSSNTTFLSVPGTLSSSGVTGFSPIQVVPGASSATTITISGELLSLSITAADIKFVASSSSNSSSCDAPASSAFQITSVTATASQTLFDVQASANSQGAYVLCLNSSVTFSPVTSSLFYVQGLSSVSPLHISKSAATQLVITGFGLTVPASGGIYLVQALSSCATGTHLDATFGVVSVTTPHRALSVSALATGSTSGHVTLCLSIDGQAAVAAPQALAIQDVTGFSPTVIGVSTPSHASTTVTLSGTGFSVPGDSVVAVKVNGSPSSSACSGSPVSDSSITISSYAVSSTSPPTLTFAVAATSAGTFKLCMHFDGANNSSLTSVPGTLSVTTAQAQHFLPNLVVPSASTPTTITLRGVNLTPLDSLLVAPMGQCASGTSAPGFTFHSNLTVNADGTSGWTSLQVASSVTPGSFSLCVRFQGTTGLVTVPSYDTNGALTVQSSVTPTISGFTPNTITAGTVQTVTISGSTSLQAVSSVSIISGTSCSGSVSGSLTTSNLTPSISNSATSLSFSLTASASSSSPSTSTVCLQFSGVAALQPAPGSLTVQVPTLSSVQPHTIAPAAPSTLTLSGSLFPATGNTIGAVAMSGSSSPSCAQAQAGGIPGQLTLQSLTVVSSSIMTVSAQAPNPGTFLLCVRFSGANSFSSFTGSQGGQLVVSAESTSQIFPTSVTTHISTRVTIQGSGLSQSNAVVVVDGTTSCNTANPSPSSNVDVSFASAASDGSSLVYNIEALASGTYQFCIRLMSSTNNFEAVSQGTLSALTPTVSQVFPLQLGVQAQTTVTIMGTRLSASATDLAVIASSSSCSSSSLTTLPSFAIGSFSSSSSSGSQLTVPVTGNTAGDFKACVLLPGQTTYMDIPSSAPLSVAMPQAKSFSTPPLVLNVFNPVSFQGTALSAVSKVLVVVVSTSSTQETSSSSFMMASTGACTGQTNNAPGVDVTTPHVQPDGSLQFTVRPSIQQSYGFCLSFSGAASSEGSQPVGGSIDAITPSAGSFSPAAVPAASAFPQTITLSGQGLLTADSMIGIIASSATACSTSSTSSPNFKVSASGVKVNADRTQLMQLVEVTDANEYFICIKYSTSSTYTAVSSTSLRAAVPAVSSFSPSKFPANDAVVLTLSGQGFLSSDKLVAVSSETECSGSTMSNADGVTLSMSGSSVGFTSSQWNLKVSTPGHYRLCYLSGAQSQYQDVSGEIDVENPSSGGIAGWKVALAVVLPLLGVGAIACLILWAKKNHKWCWSDGGSKGHGPSSSSAPSSLSKQRSAARSTSTDSDALYRPFVDSSHYDDRL